MKTTKRIHCMVISLLILALLLPFGRAAASSLTAEDLLEAVGKEKIPEQFSYADHSLDDPGIPVFYAAAYGADGSGALSVAVTCMDSDGDVCLVADGSLEPLLKNGGECILAGQPGYQVDAEYLGADGNFVYLSAPDLSSFGIFRLESTSSTELTGVFPVLTDAAIEEYQFLDLDLDGTWETTGTGYKSTTLMLPESFFGIPMMDRNNIGAVTGFLTAKGDGMACILESGSIDLKHEYSLAESRQPGENAPREPVSQGESPRGSGAAEEKSLDKKTLLIVVVVAAAAFYFYKKKKDGKPQEAQPAYEAAAPQNAEPTASASVEHTRPVESGTSGVYRIRGVSGALAGRTFPVTGTVRMGRSSSCQIRFPEGTPGVSGVHCELTAMGDQVLLKDLNSSYGTYLRDGRRVSEPLALRCGDVFTLAQNGPSFCLEQEGSPEGREFRVRDLQSGRSCQSRDRLTFGRSSRNQVVCSESCISGNHCVLFRQNGRLYLEDQNSTNGTYLESGERLAPNVPREVRRGDRFGLGSRRCGYEITED